MKGNSKKIFLLIASFMTCLLLLFAIGTLAQADEPAVETLTFQWEQADTNHVDHWCIYWGDSTGSYDATPVLTIPFDGTVQGTYTASDTLTVSGVAGSTVTKYFAAKAVTDTGVESEFSNEVAHDFAIPEAIVTVTTPVNFSITTGQPAPDPTPVSLLPSITITEDSGNFIYPISALWDGIVDGNAENGGECGPDCSLLWFTGDLGQTYEITSARIYGDAVGTRVSQTWTVVYKLNEIDEWTVVIGDAPCNGNQWFETTLSVQARYIGVQVSGATTGTQAWEAELYGY